MDEEATMKVLVLLAVIEGLVITATPSDSTALVDMFS